MFPTWTDVNGQDDLLWYSGQNLGGGTWKGTINLASHPGTGGANVNVYLSNPAHTVGMPGLRFTKDASGWPAVIPGAFPTATDAGPHSFTVTATQGTLDLYVWGVYNATTVHFPTWSSVNGQDDLIWYPATNLGKGTWKATINLANHPGTGLFDVHVYVTNGTTNNGVKP